MSLRRKILVLLSAIALIPALITATLDSQRLRSLSNDLTERNAQAQAAQALTTMQRIASEYALLLERESQRINVLTKLQAEYAERLLRSPPDERVDAAQVFFGERFGSDEHGPRLATDPGPHHYNADGVRRALPVSWSEQAFHHPPSTPRASVVASAATLVAMVGFYKKVRDPGDRVLRWQYVVLENGLTATYPGHGSFPLDFDPRTRPWYLAQKENPGLRWYRPHFDAATGVLVVNTTMPLFDADGTFIGITGIDIDLTATFDALELPPHLREGSEVMQVATVQPEQAARGVAFVLARQSAALANNNWRTLPQLETFSLGDRATNDLLMAAMRARRNGHVRAVIEGRDTFVVYHHFGAQSAYVMITVPVATATRAARDASDYARETTADHVATLFRFLLGASTLVIIVALVASRQLTKPIEHLKTAVERLAGGDFNVRAALSTGDELQTLGDAFDTMVPQLKEHARVGDALILAREIQQKLLPAAAPRVPGYDLAGMSIYSDQTGGDYFDYVPLGEAGRYGVIVADVSGHGIGPALLMATTRALLHGGYGRGLSLSELLGFVNNHLADDVTMGHYVTLYLLAIDGRDSCIEWAAAGHDPALYFEAASGAVRELGGGDIPLGIDADWTFSSDRGVELEVGDIIVMGTDGIWEAVSDDHERFGKQRIRDYIRAHAELDAQRLCQGLLHNLETFRGAQAQHDDLTIVVIKRLASA